MYVCKASDLIAQSMEKNGSRSNLVTPCLPPCLFLPIFSVTLYCPLPYKK